MKWLAISDMQVPYHDKRAVRNLIECVAAVKPDGLLCVGDEIDSPETSRWTKGMAGEYAGTLQKALDDTHDVLAGFRKALGKGKPFHLSRSNHNGRTETYLQKYAPALGSLGALRIESLLGLDELDVMFHRQMFEFEPGWVLAHGDEGGMSRIPGSTAMSLARKTGKSVVCGHTHSAGVQHETRGMNGKTSTIFGMEVGNLMDMRQAHYLKSGAANWQQAFGLLYVDGRKVTPVLVPIHSDGTFTVEGRSYG